MIDEVQRRVRAHPLRWGWAASVLAWATWVIVDLLGRGGNAKPLLYDEWLYWQISRTITGPSLAGYDSRIRGVVFPAVIRSITAVTGGIEPGYRVAAAVLTVVCVPLLTAVIAPSLVRSLGARVRPTIGRILLLNGLVWLFWRGDTIRLFSDIPALTAFAGAVALLARLASRPDADADADVGAARPRGVVAPAVVGGAAGLLLAVAANTRPAYLLVGVVAVLLLPLLLWGRSWTRSAIVVAAVVAGLAIGFVPQVAVNRAQDAGWSIVPSESSELAAFQLATGLRMQRYDTYVGPVEEYPVPKMVYANTDNLGDLDPATVASASDYLRAAVAHPVVIGGSILRHGFNGLDIRYPGTYIEDVRGPTWPTQVLNLTLVVVAFALLGGRAWRWWRGRSERPGADHGSFAARRGPVRLWFTAVLILATGPMLVTAIETRFLLPLHLFLLAVVALTASRDDLPRDAATRAVAVVGVAVTVVVLLAVSASVATSLDPPIPVRATALAPAPMAPGPPLGGTSAGS